ncbi:MAG: hypothetical protein QM570_04835 [Planctomycetota bacterium]|nr:hypothetical protein [Planctomycetota bacterium]
MLAALTDRRVGKTFLHHRQAPELGVRFIDVSQSLVRAEVGDQAALCLPQHPLRPVLQIHPAVDVVLDERPQGGLAVAFSWIDQTNGSELAIHRIVQGGQPRHGVGVNDVGRAGARQDQLLDPDLDCLGLALAALAQAQCASSLVAASELDSLTPVGVRYETCHCPRPSLLRLLRLFPLTSVAVSIPDRRRACQS